LKLFCKGHPQECRSFKKKKTKIKTIEKKVEGEVQTGERYFLNENIANTSSENNKQKQEIIQL